MDLTDIVLCQDFPCQDINKEAHIFPRVKLDPGKIKILMLSEAPPEKVEDYFYGNNNSFYLETTLNAFKDAGISVSSMQDIIDKGVYLTTAIKCGKTDYSIKADTIKSCSFLLEKEISIFPNIQCILLMGDTAIKTFNYISKRQIGRRTIPAGSTYKIRKEKYYFEDKRAFPSYLQTGKNYLIEKSKRKMIAEDIKEAFRILEK
ncbi:MAG: uracil-DNA glycosylase family protein [Candidatus Kariarchaeaceae archaeon]|jgi:uracil-DNA glycosylase